MRLAARRFAIVVKWLCRFRPLSDRPYCGRQWPTRQDECRNYVELYDPPAGAGHDADPYLLVLVERVNAALSWARIAPSTALGLSGRWWVIVAT
jgi:hypothetical protein